MNSEVDESFLALRVKPSQMDLLWAEGWRHFGPHFFRYTVAREGLLHVLPLRIELKNFVPSKSQRHIVGKNRDLEVAFVPAFVDAEVEHLFEQHKNRFTHSVPPDIYTFISGRPASIPCPCLSLSLRQQGRLIGISYLDVGETSTSSVYQCFDLNYSKRSLGILMMLLSIRYSLEQQKTFYYPGYAYLEPSEYDYKKRFSSLEYFDWNDSWKGFKLRDGI